MTVTTSSPSKAVMDCSADASKMCIYFWLLIYHLVTAERLLMNSLLPISGLY